MWVQAFFSPETQEITKSSNRCAGFKHSSLHRGQTILAESIFFFVPPVHKEGQFRQGMENHVVFVLFPVSLKENHFPFKENQNPFMELHFPYMENQIP